MKKLILLAATGLCLSLTAQTTTPVPNNAPTTPMPNNSPQVPSEIQQRFNTDYPNTTPTWDLNGENYRAEYPDRLTNSMHGILYDNNGNVVGKEERLSNGSYPNSIGDYYRQNFPNETYDVWSSTDNNGVTTYYTTRNTDVLWFDKEGKYKTKKARTKSNKTQKNDTKTNSVK